MPPAVLARLGPIGREALEAAAQLAVMPPEMRRFVRATWAAEARAPVPGGLRAIEPSWIEAALAQLPVAARAAVAAGGGDPTATWLARWACATFPAMPPADARPPPRELAAVLRLGPADLVAWLAEVGADQLAFALAGTGAVAATARVVGERLVTAAARIMWAPRAGELGSARAAIVRCRGIALDEHALVRIGARAIAPHLVHPLAARTLELRLPRALGLAIAADLRTAGEGPSWLALGAAW